MGVMVCGAFVMVGAAALLVWWLFARLLDRVSGVEGPEAIRKAMLNRCGRPLCYERVKGDAVYCPRCGHRIGWDLFSGLGEGKGGS